MQFSLDLSLLDYEGSEVSRGGYSERGDSILNDMSGTASFRNNGVDVSMELSGITPMRSGSNNNNRAEEEAMWEVRAREEEAKREVENAYVDMGKALRRLKAANLKLGVRVPPTPVRVPQTPVGGSTPIRAPTQAWPTPIGERPAGSWRFTLGGGNRPVLPMGLPGTETVQGGKVWIDFTKPPPGYVKASLATETFTTAVATTTATTTTAATAAAASTTTTSSRTAAGTTASSSTTTSTSTVKWRSGRWQGGKDLRMKLRESQRRKLGGRCERCLGEHTTLECHMNPEDLRCRYPPCRYKTGHTTSTCHELTKICVLPICNNAIGHRSFCHKTVPVEGGEPYGYSEEVARRLREDFEKFSHYLTEEEWEDLAVTDTLGGGAGSRGGGPVRRGRGGYGRGRN